MPKETSQTCGVLQTLPLASSPTPYHPATQPDQLAAIITCRVRQTQLNFHAPKMFVWFRRREACRLKMWPKLKVYLTSKTIQSVCRVLSETGEFACGTCNTKQKRGLLYLQERTWKSKLIIAFRVVARGPVWTYAIAEGIQTPRRGHRCPRRQV